MAVGLVRHPIFTCNPKSPNKKSPATDLESSYFRRCCHLEAAFSLEDLRIPPSNHLEALSHNRAGQYSIRINKQWRVCFNWNEGAQNVEITDYH
ncbi:type II toxin-antitoxin system RelE/ParE family toxin [Rubritalea profundi]|uniref:Plasmid maintenance system killer protein n=1 Tax=Rubritalea profundi TaxID=1658618 RepID=A0A2S7U0H9_9BACT|nr:type II toxin-antitoxin system RelE/ParE family toxin [Rubritalea profundi]PQJ28509.1 hypothetical protein BSZ32_08300 [Rubritalea profundi]